MLNPTPELALVSVSIDLGAGRRGVDMGPSALRIAGLTGAVESMGYTLTEAGTVTADAFEIAASGDPRLRFLDEIAAVAERARACVADSMEAGRMPLIIGGDHSLSIGTVAAVARHHRAKGERIGLIWVDAHPDMNRPETTPSGNIHGMALAVLMGHGSERLTALSGDEPAVLPENVTVLGARDVDAGERELIDALGVRVITMSEIDERGVGPCMDEALERAIRGTAGFHLSYDLDSLDPVEAPGVGTPVQGGLTYREGHLVCEKAATTERMVSLELVELNPVLDDRNRTARMGVGLIKSALGLRIL